MAVADLFVAVKNAEDQQDYSSIGEILDAAEKSGLDKQAFKEAYKTWKSTKQVVEPTPLKQIAQGAQLGFSDELAGAGSALGKLLAGDTNVAQNYKNRRDAERASSDLYQASNPGRSVALQMAGGLGLPIKGPAPAATLAGRATQAARTGAVVGGAYGLGSGRGDALDQTASTVGGALIGTVLAPAVQVGVEGVAKGSGAAVNAIRNRGKVAVPAQAPAPQAVETLAPEQVTPTQVMPTKDVPVNVNEKAKRDLLNALIKDGVDPAQAKAAVEARFREVTTTIPKPMTLADIAPTGGQVQRLGRGARVNAPAAGAQADEFLMQRNRTQGARTLSDINAISGLADQAPFLTQRGLIERARAESGPLYDQVRNLGEVDTSGLASIKDTPMFKKAVRSAKGLPDMQGRSESDAAFLDQVYKYLNGEVRRVKTAVKTGNANEMDVARVEMVKEPIRKALDAASGGTYSKALGIFADDASIAEASKAGQSVLNKSVAVMRDELKDLAPSEQEAYRAAAADAVREKLRNSGYNRDVVKQIFNSDAIIEKFKLIFGSKDAFKAFEKQMIDEAKMDATKQVMTGNSQTADKLKDAMDAGGYMDVLSGALTGDPRAAVAGVAKAGLRDRLSSMMPNAETRGEALLSHLFNPNQQQQISLLDELIRMQQQQNQYNAGAGVLTSAAGRSAPYAGTGLLNQFQGR